MKATEIIARDHRAIEALYERFQTVAEAEKKSVEEELFAALSTHEKMEDEHFYPALKEKLGNDEILKELSHEQTTLKIGVMGARVKETLSGPSEESIEKVMEKVLSHAKKEEASLFPRAEAILSAEQLEEIGLKMEPMSAAVISES